MPDRPTAASGVLCLVLVTLLSAGCTSDAVPAADRSPATGSSTGSSSATATTPAPPTTVEGLEDEVPPPDASFPASVADDGGEERAGSGGDGDGSEDDGSDDMVITGLRLMPQNGYDRLVVDLSTAAVPSWTVSYTEASTAAGDPVEVAGDAYLRLGLFTQNSSADPLPVVVGESGVVAEVRTTGSLGGYQEVLIGVRGAPAPFRTFALTDPGRIVLDIRPAG